MVTAVSDCGGGPAVRRVLCFRVRYTGARSSKKSNRVEFVGVARLRHRPGFPLTQASNLITRHRAVGDLREEDARRVNPHVWRTPRYRRRTAFASARTRELRRVT